MDRKNLKLRHLTWFVRVTVPPSVRDVIGKSELVRSLKTRDLREANRRKHAVIAELLEEIERAKPKTITDPADRLIAEAERLRVGIERGTVDPETASDILDATREHLLGEDERAARTSRLAYRVLSGERVHLWDSMVALYINECRKTLRAHTVRKYRRALDTFGDWHGRKADIGSITKRTAGSYVTEKLLTRDLAPKTLADEVAALSAFGSWLEARGYVDASPFRGLLGSVRKTPTRGERPRRRPWTDNELAKLLENLKPTDNLWSLTALAMYTGARIEELCQLKTGDVDIGNDGRPIAIHIREGKTEAARRRIPVHPVIAPLVKRLVEHADDNGYLIPDLLITGDDGKRSVLVSKRFGYACERAGLTDPALTFHSLRNTFAQRLENAGVPHETAKLLTGHKRRDMAYGVYSPGPNWDRLVDAIGKVTYGVAEETVKAIAPTVTIETRPRRRRRR